MQDLKEILAAARKHGLLHECDACTYTNLIPEFRTVENKLTCPHCGHQKTEDQDMKKLKVIGLKKSWPAIEFENGIILSAEHEQDCCESHYLCIKDLTLEDFEGLTFDLSKDDFFKRIEGYGIELVPVLGHSVKIPGYGYNNGYYSDKLTLELNGEGFKRVYDITECQEYSE